MNVIMSVCSVLFVLFEELHEGLSSPLEVMTINAIIPLPAAWVS